jgi:hypothetical protein
MSQDTILFLSTRWGLRLLGDVDARWNYKCKLPKAHFVMGSQSKYINGV